ncbi:MAG: hypothetical protein N4A39_07260 [Roseicyclus sp.]|nr:hypothetical protein [Roseicyclus sp.]
MSGGENRAVFGAETCRFPGGKTAVFPCVFLQENGAFSPAARGVADAGMRIFGKMKGMGA